MCKIQKKPNNGIKVMYIFRVKVQMFSVAEEELRFNIKSFQIIHVT